MQKIVFYSICLFVLFIMYNHSLLENSLSMSALCHL